MRAGSPLTGNPCAFLMAS